MKGYLISVFIVFILFSILGKYLEEDGDNKYDYIWGLFLSVLWPFVVLGVIFSSLIEFIVNKLKEKINE